MSDCSNKSSNKHKSGFEETLEGKQEWPPKKCVINKTPSIYEIIELMESQLEQSQKPAPVTQQ